MIAAYLTGFFVPGIGSDPKVTEPASSACAALDIHNAPFGVLAVKLSSPATIIPTKIGTAHASCGR
jgi:hypothetical protein